MDKILSVMLAHFIRKTTERILSITILMGFLFTITMGKLFTIAVGIQLTISSSRI